MASFAASIAAHVGIVAMIMCFASPLARGHSEWVLAYLIEGADGSRGRGAAASGGAIGAFDQVRQHPLAMPSRERRCEAHDQPKNPHMSDDRRTERRDMTPRPLFPSPCKGEDRR